MNITVDGVKLEVVDDVAVLIRQAARRKNVTAEVYIQTLLDYTATQEKATQSGEAVREQLGT